ncbi:FoF1 ATP synthase subunit gamma [uncultured Muribaculum sp.]|uniref:F0F1 ATP synthase subunit gamma n=1 Tax=uncultured Muribaculum sp. TaxID=1918613 RepID=UPI00350E4F18
MAQETLTDNSITVQCRPYIFEPDANAIFTSVLPLFVLAVMQETFTENQASEQAARVMAMQSANDNAKKLLDQLQLEYNKLRQQAITSELLDILGGQVK